MGTGPTGEPALGDTLNCDHEKPSFSRPSKDAARGVDCASPVKTCAKSTTSSQGPAEGRTYREIDSYFTDTATITSRRLMVQHRRRGACERGHLSEEPDESKGSRPVLEASGRGRPRPLSQRSGPPLC